MLAVTNSNGCLDTAYSTIYIAPEFQLYVPNAFTPNNDGLNDVFMLKGTGFKTETLEMYIYDRWGQLVYYTKDKLWDGKSSVTNQLVQQDVYVWKVMMRSYDDQLKSYIGHVTVVRWG